MIVTVTDQAGTSGSVTVERYGVADAIRRWYPDAPAEVHESIDNLQAGLNRSEDTSGWATYLGVTVEAAETYTVKLDESPGNYDTTHAVIVDADGDEVAGFGGPVSEEWLPAEWDAALADAGYRRVGDWNVSEGTAQVAAL